MQLIDCDQDNSLLWNADSQKRDTLDPVWFIPQNVVNKAECTAIKIAAPSTMERWLVVFCRIAHTALFRILFCVSSFINWNYFSELFKMKTVSLDPTSDGRRVRCKHKRDNACQSNRQHSSLSSRSLDINSGKINFGWSWSWCCYCCGALMRCNLIHFNLIFNFLCRFKWMDFHLSCGMRRTRRRRIFGWNLFPQNLQNFVRSCSFCFWLSSVVSDGNTSIPQF